MMAPEQRLPALLAALLGEGVSMDQIDRAVASVCTFPLGYDYTKLSGWPDDRLAEVRGFAHGQTRLLEQP